MLTQNPLPDISIIIPTFNSARTLNSCLESVFLQDYPEEKLEIVIADAGSKDATLSIIEDFRKKNGIKIKIFRNPLQTGEAGKAVGFKNSNNGIIAFIDSDNILPEPGWIKKMVEPFADPGIIASEPIEYSRRKQDGYITRYCALIGMNDPLCLFLGNYDRVNALTGKWTEIKHKEQDRGGYLEVKLNKAGIPTIGANGFFIRRQVLNKYGVTDYLFDIDVLCGLISSEGEITIAKVKTGIIHIFSGSIKTFALKQKRRVRDYIYYSRLGTRKYPWNSVKKSGIFVFALCTLTQVPLWAQSIKGCLKKPDTAWFFHPLACLITLWEYGCAAVSSVFIVDKLDRGKWRQ
ncbi:MAG: glycosyltransferase family 2 protein [Candidatus Omnitrophica bacterium]|nr:glycosyltransferase family 2 protein [Candidatus Omnitrophota bacterium]